jgi:hypothetical protein
VGLWGVRVLSKYSGSSVIFGEEWALGSEEEKEEGEGPFREVGAEL